MTCATKFALVANAERATQETAAIPADVLVQFVLRIAQHITGKSLAIALVVITTSQTGMQP